MVPRVHQKERERGREEGKEINKDKRKTKEREISKQAVKKQERRKDKEYNEEVRRQNSGMEESVQLLFLSGCVVNQLLSGGGGPPLEPITDRVIWRKDEEMNNEKKRDGKRERERQKGALRTNKVAKEGRRTTCVSILAVNSPQKPIWADRKHPLGQLQDKRRIFHSKWENSHKNIQL